MRSDFHKSILGLQQNLLNFAYMLTSNRDDAYDLVQETTLKALDNEDKYSENVNLKGWLMTIMRNIFINNYRKSSRMTSLSSQIDNWNISEMPSLEYSQETPEGSVTVGDINSALMSLPEIYRRPLSMYIVGYSYDEISQRLGVATGTVKSRIFVARRRLQKLLKDYK